MTTMKEFDEEVERGRSEGNMHLFHSSTSYTSKILAQDFDFSNLFKGYEDSCRNRGDQQLADSLARHITVQSDLHKIQKNTTSTHDHHHHQDMSMESHSRLRNQFDASDQPSSKPNHPPKREVKAIEAVVLVTSHRPQFSQSITKLPSRVGYFPVPLSAKVLGPTSPSIQGTQLSVLICFILLVANPTLRAGFCAPTKPIDMSDYISRGIKTSTTVESLPSVKPSAPNSDDLVISQQKYATLPIGILVTPPSLPTSSLANDKMFNVGPANRDRSEANNHGYETNGIDGTDTMSDHEHDHDDDVDEEGDDVALKILDDQSSPSSITKTQTTTGTINK